MVVRGMTAGVKEYLKEHWQGYAVVCIGIILFVIYLIDEYVQHGTFTEHFSEFGVPRIILFLTPLLFAAVGWLVDRKVGLERDARKSEDKFRDLFENAYDIIFTLDLEGNILSANQAAIKISGYDAGEIRTLNIAQLLPADLLQDARMRIARIAAGETQPPLEYEFIKKDGSRAIIELTSRAIFEKAKLVSIHCIARDITERKHAEMEVRETNEKLNSMIRTSPYAIIGVDTSNRVEIWNPAAEKLFGWSKHEVLGRVLPTVPADNQQSFRKNMDALLGGRSLLDIESVAQKKDGSIIDTRISAAPVFDTRGELKNLISFISDITERKKGEEDLKIAKANFEDLYDNSPDMLASVDAETARIIRCNQTFAKATGYTKEEIVGRNVFDLYHPDCLGSVKKAFQLFKETGVVSDVELQLRQKDGGYLDVSLNVTAVRDKNGKILYSRSSLRDITERKRIEEAMRESEAKFRELANSITDIFYAMDKDLKCTYWNEASEMLTGVLAKDVIGNSILDVFPYIKGTKEEQHYLEVLRTQQPKIFEQKIQMGVKKFVYEVTVYPSKSGLSVFAKDITERKHIEEALQESEERYRSLFENSPTSIWEDDLSDVKKYIDGLRASGVSDFREYFVSHPEAVLHCVNLVRVVDVNKATLELYQVSSKAELLAGLGKIFVKESFDVFKEELITFAEGKTSFEVKRLIKL